MNLLLQEALRLLRPRPRRTRAGLPAGNVKYSRSTCISHKPIFLKVVDPSGAYFRREGYGGHYLCGMSPEEDQEPAVDNLESVS